mmetsp:Transcript_14619/g.44644  ORF Transcript_14619/g.44644 Transcript_14619/m.44644 type:complete len:205 (+) Transcript_14619:1086-1700(+)|eukprot:scaffold60780_cov32-Tisochrysis_lutea.AAC.2
MTSGWELIGGGFRPSTSKEGAGELAGGRAVGGEGEVKPTSPPLHPPLSVTAEATGIAEVAVEDMTPSTVAAALVPMRELPSSMEGEGSASGLGACRSPACGRTGLALGLAATSGAGSSVASSAPTEERQRSACLSCFSVRVGTPSRMLMSACAARNSSASLCGSSERWTVPQRAHARPKRLLGSSVPASSSRLRKLSIGSARKR